MRRLVLPLLLAALLSGCAIGGGTETEEPTTEPTFDWYFGEPTPAPTPSVPEVCLELEAEVTAVTQTTLLVPPEGGGMGAYINCWYVLAPKVEDWADGCHCLFITGPLDAEGQGTDWLTNLQEALSGGGEMLEGVGDGAYYHPEEEGANLWVVQGQAVLHIGIDQQYLTSEQLVQLADVALDRLASTGWQEATWSARRIAEYVSTYGGLRDVYESIMADTDCDSLDETFWTARDAYYSSGVRFSMGYMTAAADRMVDLNCIGPGY